MDLYGKAVVFWHSYKIASVEDLDRHLDNFRVLFAFHSGKIENEEITNHDTREIFENGMVTGLTGSPRILLERQNQRLCYEFLSALSWFARQPPAGGQATQKTAALCHA